MRRKQAGQPAAQKGKKAFLLRIPAPLFADLRRWAEQDMRSINGQIEWLLRDALRRRARGNSTTKPDAPDAGT
ncbi:MAG TPA: Arc family DNA-binding protein [bacterium]|nr:Arc family DNA-binding protein [bacterium]